MSSIPLVFFFFFLNMNLGYKSSNAVAVCPSLLITFLAATFSLLHCATSRIAQCSKGQSPVKAKCHGSSRAEGGYTARNDLLIRSFFSQEDSSLLVEFDFISTVLFISQTYGLAGNTDVFSFLFFFKV